MGHFRVTAWLASTALADGNCPPISHTALVIEVPPGFYEMGPQKIRRGLKPLKKGIGLLLRRKNGRLQYMTGIGLWCNRS